MVILLYIRQNSSYKSVYCLYGNILSLGNVMPIKQYIVYEVLYCIYDIITCFSTLYNVVPLLCIWLVVYALYF